MNTRNVMRHLATLAIASSLVLGAGLAWSAPHKTPAPAAKAYVIRAGDGGWWKVAHAHGISLSQLLAENHATTATPLRAGQTVKLPPGAHDPPKAAKPAKPAKAAAAHKR